MKNISKLNEKQRKLIEDNYGLIWCIHDKHFRKFTDFDTYKDIANIAICKAALKWDEEKMPFGTFLEWYLRSEVQKYYKKWYGQREKFNRVAESLDTILPGLDTDELTVGDTIASNENIGDDVIERIYWEDKINKQPGKRRKIIKMRYEGYLQKEIGEKLGMTCKGVSDHLMKFKKAMCY